MAYIDTPDRHKITIGSLNEFLEQVGAWRKKYESQPGFLSNLWYRGVNEQYDNQVPGVYRRDFMEQAVRLFKDIHKDDEERRLHLEREMLNQFRTAGAAFLNTGNEVEVYFTAQHYGMPTRLLDWSTNPLAALFFACDGKDGIDGFVHAMDARKIIPPDAKQVGIQKLPQAIMSMRHPFVAYAIGLSFWKDPKTDHYPHILPVRPDVAPGRIGQQSSCFTLHMHKSKPVTNDTLISIRVSGASKKKVREELHRLNVNHFTIYYDLDHLSKQINRTWGVK
jgi:hypothetical protein